MFKKLLPFILFLFIFNSIKAQNEFITIWKPSNTGNAIVNSAPSTSNQIWFPGKGTNFQASWEEIGYPAHTGNINNITSTKNFLIDFGVSHNPNPNDATYRVKITNGNGNFQAIKFPDDVYVSNTLWPLFLGYNGDKQKIIEVSQWGNIVWNTMDWAFSECTNLDIKAFDAPKLSQVISTFGMFYGCTALYGNSSFNTWNTSSITNMSHMFASATQFNQPIGNWDTSHVTNMNWMLHYLDYFNQPIGNWDTSNVTTMIHMLHECYAFNQNLSGWDTSNVTDMRSILGDTHSFNYSLGSWNLQSVMLAGGMITGSGLNCENYDNTLIGWANNSLNPSNLTIGNVSPMNYSSQYGANARNQLVNNKNWILTGDSYNPECRSELSTSETLIKSDISIYPNPATDFIFIKNLKGINTYKIFDTSGRIVQQNILNTESIDITALSKGNYILQIVLKDKTQTFKFIKK
ncbi:BspA family leucine-rich repeat surface protein [Chryseobacterium sp. SIMBA_038]|uniref:BspA family leucine-rich repeat surface protein n=3 Tax=Bacteria TaxID=2 RepID=UPI00397D0F3D